MANLIRDIISGVWMLNPNEAALLTPLVNKLLAGEKVDFSHYVTKQDSYQYSGKASGKAQTVAVLSVKGIILKNSYCGSTGMIDLHREIEFIRKDQSIGAVVLDVDSGGGEASYMPNVARALRQLREEKPVIGFVSGMAASAAYYLISQCTNVYASVETDFVGSVGTMIQVTRDNPEYKDKEYISEGIYATKSVDKNAEFEAALKGDYALLKTNILDPLNEVFHQEVKLGRPDLSDDVLGGKLLLGQQAIDANLIDGYKSFDECVEMAFSLIK